MADNRTSRPHIVSTMVMFGFTTAIAAVLFVIALIVWLAEAMGSFVAASLLVGGFFAVLSLVIYMIAIRGAIERIREQLQTIYEVAHAAQVGYKWVSDKFYLLLGLLEKTQKSE